MSRICLYSRPSFHLLLNVVQRYVRSLSPARLIRTAQGLWL